jgi:drug/metabolite transporter (DMT)-like permease
MLAISESIFGACIIVLGKVALKEIPQFSYIFLRFLLGSITILPFYLREKPRVGLSIVKVMFLSILSTVNVFTFVIGIKHTTANSAGLLFTLLPIVVAVLSVIIIKETVTPRKVLGILLGFFGALLAAIIHANSDGLDLMAGFVGNLIILMGIVSFAFYTVLSKNFQKKHTSIELTTWFVFTTTVVFAIPAISENLASGGWWHYISLKGIFAISVTGIIGAALYYILYQYLIRNASPTVASMTQYLQPFGVFLLSSLFIGENITAVLLIGAVLSLVGVWITANSNGKK